jgi:hypothetical protein
MRLFMRNFFFLSFLFISLHAFAQDTSTPRITGDKHKKFAPLNGDSMADRIQRMKDSFNKTMQDLQNENNIRNLQEVMRNVEDHKRKQKTKSVIYIVIGVGMLFVLFFGLRRKTK